jgi:hypothetical protein
LLIGADLRRLALTYYVIGEAVCPTDFTNNFADLFMVGAEPPVRIFIFWSRILAPAFRLHLNPLQSKTATQRQPDCRSFIASLI